jgi:hypothetical protein
MGCRCNERREAFKRIISAPRGGGMEAAIVNAKFIAKSTAEDVVSVMRSRIVGSRLNLQGRRRR